MESCIYVIGALLMFLVSLSAHELGHLIAGLAVGYRFELFIAGFIKIYRNKDQKIRIGFNKELSMFGGVAATTPRDLNADNKKKFAIIIISGPIASFLFTLLCFTIAGHIPEPWKFFLAIAGAASFGIFFATIIPNKAGIFFTDRKRFQRLLSHGNSSNVEIALLKLITLHSVENNMLNADLHDIETVKTEDDPFIRLFAYYYETMYNYDHKSEMTDYSYNKFAEMADELNNSLIRTVHKELKAYIHKQ